MEQTKNIFHSSRIEKLGALFLLVATLFVGIHAINAFANLVSGSNDIPQNTITVEGVGSVTAVPDIATITYTFSETADTASQAQEVAAQKSNVALAVLRDEFDIEEVDIKTTSYNVSPQYSRPQPCFGGICPEYEQSIIGYSVSQTVQVKVRDTDDAGAVLSALGDAGVSNVYGPSFAIDDPDALKEEARNMAIAAAREKGKALAQELDVRLVRVVSFWENSNDYYPYGIAEARSFDGGFGGDIAPELPAGENEITSRVSITYEIR